MSFICNGIILIYISTWENTGLWKIRADQDEFLLPITQECDYVSLAGWEDKNILFIVVYITISFKCLKST